MTDIWLSVTFFIIALAYSMVGFGGGSSYLAVLVLAGYSYQGVPSLALICNLIVTAGGFWNFFKAGYFAAKKVTPFVCLSIPFAYWGGQIPIGKQVFSILLGLALLAVALRMLFPGKTEKNVKEVTWKRAWFLGLPLGAFLGFISGLLGIGGGIFLSPILMGLRWTYVKEAGACASFFIFVNSLSGLLGHLHQGNPELGLLAPLAIAVLLGGQIGSRLGIYRIPSLGFGRVMATLIMGASVKLISGGLGW